jgi:hypothetical protein
MIKITRATHQGDWQIDLEFTSGEVGQVDLADLVKQSGSMVVPPRDPKVFGFFSSLARSLGATGSS